MLIKKSSHNLKFTNIEKFKLIRNAIILIIFSLAIISFNIIMIYLIKKFNWIVVISTILLVTFAILIFFYFLKYIKDLKRGEADIYTGVIKTKRESFDSEYPNSYYISFGNTEHQVSGRAHAKVKENDQVIIKKAHFSNYTLSVTIKNNHTE